MKKPLEILSLVGLFLFSFVLFLYLTFPYEVLTEKVSVELSGATGYSVRIGGISPRLPIGAEIKDIKIESKDGSSRLHFTNVEADIGLFSLLLGQISPKVEIKSGGGVINVEMDLGILDLLNRSHFPKYVSLDAKKFPLADLIRFGLGTMDASSNPIAGLLSNIGLIAKLNGKVEFDLDSKKPTQSVGEVNLNLTDALLVLSHPMVGLEDQKFNKAKIQAKVENGKVHIKKTSMFVSKFMHGFVGTVSTPPFQVN